MSNLLQILGRAMTVDMTDLIWHWLNTTRLSQTDTESDRNRQLDRIIELLSGKKTESAQEQLKLYLFENPSCNYGRMASAAICLSKNQIPAAIEELNSVYVRQPNNTMALYTLGYCYEMLGKEAQAVEFYQDCLKFKNYLQLPRQRLAAVYFKNRQFEKTIQEYELLKNEYPDDIATLTILGHLYIAVGRHSDAIATFNTAILIHPDNFYSEDDEIEQLIGTGQLDEALEQIQDLLHQQPEKVNLIAREADVLTMLGANDEAISQYQQAIRICPDFLEATIKLGTLYLQNNTDELAAQQFNQAVEINDKIVDAYLGLAIAQKLAGKNSDALATLSLAAAIEANTSLLFSETAGLQFKIRFGQALTSGNGSDSGNLIEAVITAHRQQIELQPQNPDLHYRLGVLMMSVARPGNALKAFQRALEINRTYSRARSKLVICLYETNQEQNALEHLISHDCLNKDTLALHYKIALLYCDRVKFASSLINLERFMEDNFASAEATVNISIVLQNLGLLDVATATWDNLADTANQAASSN